MIDIKELIAARQRRDPAFRAVRDARTGNYYLQNQVVFIYVNSKSPDEAARLTGQYIDETNIARRKEGKSLLRLTILALSNNVVVVSGRGTNELKGTGPTPLPPPPPPPWKKCDIWKDRACVIQILSGANKGHFDVIASSHALAAGILVGRDAEDMVQ